ncbi:YidC/Oxa1 family membrane protein insertase [Patescibacteria group bacterium]|nr:YidC/Oxa1 family membrane protein insertase [Patescibacteria group bacterium]MBU1703185.1 YidC/Oxa1 family membrane protein insertase [Patescibacteria group bacterium]MBU1953531.1 YidC/Oxa1 family membrane protein insertase [Patescibacteria group bacterium]
MKKKNSILQYIIVFLVVYLTLSFFLKPGQEETSISGADFDVIVKKEFSVDELVTVQIRNNTETDTTIKSDCPQEPLTVYNKQKGEWTQITSTRENGCEDSRDTTIKPHEKAIISYQGWNHALFGETGTYKVELTIEPSIPIQTPVQPEIKTISYVSNEFEIKPQGWFGWLWSAGFYQPIYNALIYITSVIPGNDLGLAIIILTLIIRTLLLIPSHRSLKSQRKIQELQPKLNHIKEKHKGNQEMIAKETMMLWKEHKVNPLSSCLPLFIQLPFLIAIFYVIQGGLNPDNVHLLYGGLKSFSLSSINTNFLGILQLKEVNVFVLPLIVGGLQFFQMKLAMMRSKKKKEAQGKEKEKGNEMEMANKMMIYIMPVMIAVFTASVPSGVGLYWAVSTTYGIAQQFIVNKQVTTESSKVRVIKK